MDKIDDDHNEDSIIGSDGKMVIKLKIPKLSAAMGGDQKPSEKDVIGKRVCPECKKEFSSGKALGGHMRVHVQSSNKNTFLKPSKTLKFKKYPHHDDVINGDVNLKREQQRKPYYLSCVNDEGKPTCYTCGKIFPSMKSLFGHMRCHPDRSWRGIQPPPDSPAAAAAPRRVFVCGSSSSSLSENGLSGNELDGSNDVVDDGGDQVVDLTRFLRGWSVTERRGRPAVKEADDDVDELLLEAAEDLLNFANSAPSMAESSVVTQRQLRLDMFEGCSNSYSPNEINEKLPSFDLRLTDNGIDNGKGKAVMEEEIEGKINPPEKMEFTGGSGIGVCMLKNSSDNESDGRNTNHNKINPYNKIKRKKKIKLMMELDHGAIFSGDPTPPPPPAQPPSTESKYKCTTCSKCFTTHQALGGHRSSHNKSKITSADHHQNEEFSGQHVAEVVEFSGDIMQTPVSVNSNSSFHQCKICDKNFPTGQALGGHQRCHSAPSSQVTSTGEGASQTGSGQKVLNFDLNEMPPATMEEDESGTGNGYASSSYNSNMG